MRPESLEACRQDAQPAGGPHEKVHICGITALYMGQLYYELHRERQLFESVSDRHANRNRWHSSPITLLPLVISIADHIRLPPPPSGRRLYRGVAQCACPLNKALHRCPCRPLLQEAHLDGTTLGPF